VPPQHTAFSAVQLIVAGTAKLAFVAFVAFGKGSGIQPGFVDTQGEIVVVGLGTARKLGFADLDLVDSGWADHSGWAKVVDRWEVVVGRC
jgi:hypothetical protein